ncbi:Cullin binding-domain-containing protein [Armillaria fumosa]|nr:Cullin binding-domain-containing protein [Armillaria fumosa]
MPPKRKQVDETPVESSSTRATRSSTRASTAKNREDTSGPTSQKSTKKVAAKTTKKAAPKGAADEEQPPAKKARTSNPRVTKRGKKSNTTVLDDESFGLDDPAGPSKPVAKGPEEAKKLAAGKSEPYAPARSVALFETYADPDTPDVIGPEGLEKLCLDANIPMEGALPLLFSWQLEAQEMGKFTRDEWIKWTTARRISTLSQIYQALADLDDLLIDGKPPLKRPSNAKKNDEPYDRTAYWTYANDTKDAFRKLYMFCFTLVKPPQSRNIDMETATAFWTVLLAPKSPLMKDVLEFVGGKGESYKAANKDLWTMMLEFCETMSPNLDGYEADGVYLSFLSVPPVLLTALVGMAYSLG